jgi:hypothetical protein
VPGGRLPPVLAIAGIAVVAGGVRARGLFSDFWLDEIWSLNGALAARSWQDVFLHINLDNNHHLNTLYLFAMGDGASAVQYRLLAFVCGVLSVVVASAIAARDGRGPGVVAALTFGSSYLLVFYSSEARGYAPVVLFSLLAWYIVQRHADRPGWSWILALSACTLAGAMAHRTFGFFLAGAYVWFDLRTERQSTIRAATRLTWRTFALPVALVVAFAAISLRNTAVGGGPSYRLHTVLAQALSTIGSGPASGGVMWAIAGFVGALFAVALIDRRQARDDRWIFYLISVVILPMILGLAGRPETLSPRYFIVPAALALLAISIFLGHAIARGGRSRLAGLLLTATLVSLGVWRAVDGRSFDRGGHHNAMTEMLAGRQADAVTVASADRFGGHDFRTKMIVDYYRRANPQLEALQYVDEAGYPASGTDWMIVESAGPRAAEPEYRDRFNRVFRLHREYPTSELSGITWHLYRWAAGPR